MDFAFYVLSSLFLITLIGVLAEPFFTDGDNRYGLETAH